VGLSHDSREIEAVGRDCGKDEDCECLRFQSEYRGHQPSFLARRLDWRSLF
jgi:hypothetical protein